MVRSGVKERAADASTGVDAAALVIIVRVVEESARVTVSTTALVITPVDGTDTAYPIPVVSVIESILATNGESVSVDSPDTKNSPVIVYVVVMVLDCNCKCIIQRRGINNS